jgi:hypothetical protein
MVRGIAIVLIALGVVGVVFGEIPYKSQTQHVTMGPMTVDVKERKSLPMPRLAGVLVAAAGVGLLVSARKRPER